MRRCWNNFALDIKWDSALLPFLYLSFYHWKMMAVHHSTTQQWATTAVNHNTFISAINTTKIRVCACVYVRKCLGVCLSEWVYMSSRIFFCSLTSPLSLTLFCQEHFVIYLQ